MIYTDADVFVYQILDVLVSEYNYQIISVPNNKKDLWLANSKNEEYPLLRLNALASTSIVFEKEYIEKVKAALRFVFKMEDIPLVIINTNEESETFTDLNTRQIIVTDTRISEPNLLTQFPKLQDAIHKVEDNQEECAKCAMHLEKKQYQRIKAARKFSWKKLPLISSVIAAMITFVFIGLVFLHAGDSGIDFATSLVSYGGYYKALVAYHGEFWRIFTMSFFHSDPWLVLFYVIGLIQMGTILEKQYKKGNYFIIFIVSLLVGNLCTYAYDNNDVFLGIGAGVFGIMGSLIPYLWDTKLYKNRLFSTRISQIVLIQVINIMFSTVSYSGILVGLITGCLLGFILYPSKRLENAKKHFVVCLIAIVGMIGYLAYNVNGAYPKHEEFDKRVVSKYRELGFDDYADKIEKCLIGAYEE